MRVVLDTNVVVSALVFADGRLAWLRETWRDESLRPVACRETISELIRVLAYPKFRLSADDRQELLSEFLPYTEHVALPARWPALPRCRDPHDRVFQALTLVARADVLVSGDAALLEMRDSFARPILSPDELRQQLPQPGR